MKKIQLSRGLLALVSDVDYPMLRKYKWSVRPSKTRSLYTLANIRGKNKSMHQLIIPVVDHGFVIDHKDGNGLNNQRSNLRVITRSLNEINAVGRKNNKTGCIGVHVNTSVKNGKTYRYFVAAISVNGKRIKLGLYSSLTKAIAARKKAEEQYCKGVICNSRIPHPKPPGRDHPILKRYYGGQSGIRGVYKKDNKWIGRFADKGKYYHTSAFYDKLDAFREYKKMFKKYFGFNTPFNNVKK